jgi:hypothetical protein
VADRKRIWLAKEMAGATVIAETSYDTHHTPPSTKMVQLQRHDTTGTDD